MEQLDSVGWVDESKGVEQLDSFGWVADGEDSFDLSKLTLLRSSSRSTGLRIGRPRLIHVA